MLRRTLIAAIHGRRFVSQSAGMFRKMPDPMEHATGIERKELEAYADGCEDPFQIKTIMKRGKGTQDEPNMIPSAFDARLVGCICCGNRFAQWMWLEKDCPKRCECGYWFELEPVEPFYEPNYE
ncbi:cytochrome c oxidase subunit 5B, mitochondrial-like [Teleopsis dalmanni]|uniref:cytochrome c oxidase subunit 5B, mitochondrial-like n=1 Tax=Teleopsis dalmanni TaxID=139649 RepID=UPI0018CD3164|nr:cytochrome c oxidase subunit 5B, mitochondrial-like [Teleopsis dalmanni]XP_037954446.1 cytochrome c oxidase subunit 5B, mitochondrial-like [Teleopsis dalmanni]